MSGELAALDAYFYTTLSGSAVLQAGGITGYFGEQAPNQQPVPFILWTLQAPSDVSVVAGVRIGVQTTHIIRVVSQARSWTDIEAFADEIDALLHRSAGTANGHVIGSCVRTAPYELLEDRGDVQWRHLGGRYESFVQ